MSDPALTTVLTPDRLADLRRIATGDMRRPDGPPREIQRVRLAWLAQHGFVEVKPSPPRSTPAERRACVTVTAKGRAAIAEDDARRAARNRVVAAWIAEECEFPCVPCGAPAGVPCECVEGAS
jgi:hypothetical protein